MICIWPGGLHFKSVEHGHFGELFLDARPVQPEGDDQDCIDVPVSLLPGLGHRLPLQMGISPAEEGKLFHCQTARQDDLSEDQVHQLPLAECTPGIWTDLP